MKRAGFYVDGFNFYHAIANRRQDHLKWMSYMALAKLLILRDEEVAYVKVFSAYATHLPRSMVRHRVITRAWEAEGCECIMGQFKKKQVYCKTCRQSTLHYEEKESDVNIAIYLLDDCRRGICDSAYILSTDSDIAPALRMCHRTYPHISLVTVAAPDRSVSKENVAAGARAASVSWRQVESSLMPREVFRGDGSVAATRPVEYDPPV